MAELEVASLAFPANSKLEGDIKAVVEGLGAPRLPRSSSARVPSPIPPSAPELLAAYQTLASDGFLDEDSWAALRATGADLCADPDAPLEWLLLNTNRARFPAWLAGQASAAGGARVAHVGAAPGRPETVIGGATDGGAGGSAPSSGDEATPPPRGAAATSAARANPAPHPRPPAGDEKREEGRRNAAWILSMAGNEPSDCESFGSPSSVGSSHPLSSSSSSLDDWDPSESPAERAARKGAEKAAAKREAMPVEERRALAASDLARARQAALDGKKMGDRQAQRQAGQEIGRLKRELEALGVTEAEAEALAPGSGGLPPGGLKVAGATEAPGSSAEARGSGSIPAAAPPQLPPSPPSAASSEDVGFALDGLFDAVAAAVDATPARPRDPDAPPPWLAEAARRRDATGGGVGGRGSKKSGGSGGKAGGPPRTEHIIPPREELRRLWAARPGGKMRFHRLEDAANPADGAGRGPVRFRVALEETVRKGKGRTEKLAVVEIPARDDGWADAEGAQNATATRALFEVSEESEVLWRRLAPVPFRRLWFKWAWEAREGGGEGEDGEGGLGAVKTAAQRAEELAEELAGALRGEASGREAAAGRGLRGDAHLRPGTSAGLPATAAAAGVTTRDAHAAGAARVPAPASVAGATSAQLKLELEAFRASSEGRRWAAERGSLPIAGLREALSSALKASDVCIVSAETGSGKTTQVPQYLLEEAISELKGADVNVVVTQPRRVAATSVALRVASERGERGTGTRGGMVGYAVRMDSRVSPTTRLLFCTTGVLLRRLAGDPDLSGVSHVVLDEVHERTLEGDFLLTVLRDLVARRRGGGGEATPTEAEPSAAPRPPPGPLKLLLMSATMDAKVLSQYFGGCPVLSSPGRTFPVESLHLEDAYERSGYVLEPGSRACRRPGRGRAVADRALRSSAVSGADRTLVKAGWGDVEGGLVDEGCGGEVLNPSFDPTGLEGLPTSAVRNLKRLDERVLDMDLVEHLVTWLCHEPAGGRGTADRGGGPGVPGRDVGGGPGPSEVGVSGGPSSRPGTYARAPPGAILVFLPGVGEIDELRDRLGVLDPRRHLVLPLHSRVQPREQQRCFATPSEGVRKIVLATNVAETSVTIPDVTVVVDSGMARERRYDSGRGLTSLVLGHISRASAAQRRGRAGRTCAGTCYHLVTRARAAAAPAVSAPEMMRVALDELVLSLHALGAGPAGPFLARAPDPPPPATVERGVAELVALGALSEEPEALTALGRHLALLPVDARLGKLLVLGCLLGAAAPSLAMAACLSHKAPWAHEGSGNGGGDPSPVSARPGPPPIHRDLLTCPAELARVCAAAGRASDPLAAAGGLLAAVDAKARGGQRAMRQFCIRVGLDSTVCDELSDMMEQFAVILSDAGFAGPGRSDGPTREGRERAREAGGVPRGGRHPPQGPRTGPPDRFWYVDPGDPANRHAAKPGLLAALPLVAAYPLVAAAAKSVAGEVRGAARVPRFHMASGPVVVHRSSRCYGLSLAALGSPFLTHLDTMRTSRHVSVAQCSPASAGAVLLLGGEARILAKAGTVRIDGRLEVRASPTHAALLKALRRAFAHRLQDGAGDPEALASDTRAADAVVRALESEEAVRSAQGGAA